MKKNILRTILIILLIGNFFTIFGFSDQDGEESKSVSREVTITITENIKSVQELEKNEKEKVINKTEKIIRKIAHFSIYTILGILLMALLNTYNLSENKKIAISLIVGIIYATTDEIHQSFIPERTAQFADVMIDTMGVLFGVLVLMLTIEIIKILINSRHKTRKNMS